MGEGYYRETIFPITTSPGDDGLVKHLSARLMEADRNLDQALLSRKKARVEKERILIEVASLLEDLDATMKKAPRRATPQGSGVEIPI